MLIAVALIIGIWLGMFFMSIFSVGAYEKGFKDAKVLEKSVDTDGGTNNGICNKECLRGI